MRPIIAELIGTFFLVLVVGLVVGALVAEAAAPFAIAGVLCVSIAALGHASGAHFNPAVSVAAWLRRRINSARLVGYVIAQLLGAYLAVLACSMVDGWVASPPGAVAPASQVFLAESIFTFLLVLVILNVAGNKATEGNSYYPFAIAGAVFVGILCVGTVSGAVFNPAVGAGLVALGELPAASLVIYVASQLAGAIAAAWVDGVLNPAVAGR